MYYFIDVRMESYRERDERVVKRNTNIQPEKEEDEEDDEEEDEAEEEDGLYIINKKIMQKILKYDISLEDGIVELAQDAIEYLKVYLRVTKGYNDILNDCVGK